MSKTKFTTRMTLGTAMAALIAASLGAAAPAPALAQPAGASKPTNDVALSAGTGRLIQLDGAMSDLFVANDGIADVQVRSSNQIYIFGKAPGETTIYATNKAGRVLYSANVRVGTNIGSIDEMLSLAMPDARIQATPMNGIVLLTGTVAAPQDVEEANRLVQAFVGTGTQVVSRLKTATPLQVMLKVKIAEVSRSLIRNIGVNLLTKDTTGGFTFGIGSGRNPGKLSAEDLAGFPNALIPLPGGGYIEGPYDPSTGTFVNPRGTSVAEIQKGPGTTLGLAGRLLGLDILAAIDLAENGNLATTLAEPTLTALSGETASFLAGGEFPIPISNGINGLAIEYKQFGVSLAFTPVVLEGGRISMRVRPEVSELSAANGITLNGFNIPGLSTRRTETTVELGSGQSFMIGGLMRNNSANGVEKAPFLGDLPILGTLFRSKAFRKDESELVIVVTPYLVKPVSADKISLPTDGFRQSNDSQSLFLDQREDGRTGERRPGPTVAPPHAVNPGMGSIGSAELPQPAAPAPVKQAALPARAAAAAKPSAQPGFSF
jgi:pilus assembly protein CpaC